LVISRCSPPWINGRYTFPASKKTCEMALSYEDAVKRGVGEDKGPHFK
jgi:hypothetical protein